MNSGDHLLANMSKSSGFYKVKLNIDIFDIK